MPNLTRFPVLRSDASTEDIAQALDAVVHSAGFSVRPKTATLADLVRREESLRARLTGERADRERNEQARRNRYRRIQEFIDKNLGEEASG